jgi:diguanylate cyclase (GGDEF)-like protein
MRGFMAMRLVPQSLAMICLLVLFSFGTALATRHFVVLPRFAEIGAHADRKDLRRALLAIDARKLQLTALAYKNAVSDPAYGYFEHRSPQFIDDNFPIDSLATFNIDLIAFFDRSNQLVDQRYIDAGAGNFSQNPPSLADIEPHLLDVDRARPHAPIFDSGLMSTGLGPHLYATASVMRTDGNSEARGSLLLGIALDKEFVRDIEESAQLDITLLPLSTAEREQDVRNGAPEHIVRDQHDRMTWFLADNSGRPIAKLILNLPPSHDADKLWALPLLFAFIVAAAGGIGLLVALHYLLIEPIRRIGEHLQNVRTNADYNLRLNSRLGNEIGDLSRHIDSLVTQVQKQQDLLQAQSVEMQRLSYNDGLTGLANRRRFDQALALNWALAQRNQTSVALIMCDVDYFKPYNDHYGHLRGDDALRKLGAVIRRVVTRQSDLAARYGGEEFSILLPDTDENGALEIAERVQKELRELAIPHAASLIDDRLTVSLGIAAVVPGVQQAPRTLVQRADEALYAAKAAGRNRIMRASASGS